jgi:hypothetical protein
MVVCNKCNIEKPIDQFFVETKKDTGKQYRKKYCNDCFRQQARDWKEKNRISKTKQKQIEQEKIKQEELRLKNLKVCSKCSEAKGPECYYAYRKSICKECIKTFEKKKYYDAEEVKKENGGTLRCPPKPGVYLDDYQRFYTKEILTAIGWLYNEEKNIFYKPGLKDKDGNWEIKFDSERRGDIKRQYVKIRNKMTVDKLPYITVKGGEKKGYNETIINKILYEFFIDKVQLKDLAVKYNISANSIMTYNNKVYKLFLRND